MKLLFRREEGLEVVDLDGFVVLLFLLKVILLFLVDKFISLGFVLNQFTEFGSLLALDRRLGRVGNDHF